MVCGGLKGRKYLKIQSEFSNLGKRTQVSEKSIANSMLNKTRVWSFGFICLILAGRGHPENSFLGQVGQESGDLQHAMKIQSLTTERFQLSNNLGVPQSMD